MAYVTRAMVLARSTRRRQEVESAVFGGTLLLQEWSRWDVQQADRFALDPTDTNKVYTLLRESSLFAAGVIVPDTGEPMFTAVEVSDWRDDDAVWSEVVRITGLLRALSEVGPESLKSGDPAADAGRGTRSRGRQRTERGTPGSAGEPTSDAG